MKQLNTVFLGIGSNVNKRENIRSCLHYFFASFKHCKQSPVYQSAAFGFKGNDFYNLVIEIKTHFLIEALKQWLMSIEDIHGRDRTQHRYSNRTLDIDILLFNGDIYDGNIIIPRPEILTQAYVLKPLTDMAGDMKHPTTQKSFNWHWQNMNDSQKSTINLVDM